MIESCSAKRMLAAIIFLGGLTFLVLVIESNWTESTTRSPEPVPSNVTNINCWLREDFEISEECHPCSDFEITSQSNEACKETNYKEALQCKSSGKVYRSCAKVSWIEERKFWKFEFIVFVLSVVFTCTVFFRQQVLNTKVMLRIQKQLASCP